MKILAVLVHHPSSAPDFLGKIPTGDGRLHTKLVRYLNLRLNLVLGITFFQHAFASAVYCEKKYFRCLPIMLFGMMADSLSRMSFVDSADEVESKEERFSRNRMPCSTTSVQNWDISHLIAFVQAYLHSFIHVFRSVGGHLHERG